MVHILKEVNFFWKEKIWPFSKNVPIFFSTKIKSSEIFSARIVLHLELDEQQHIEILPLDNNIDQKHSFTTRLKNVVLNF